MAEKAKNLDSRLNECFLLEFISLSQLIIIAIKFTAVNDLISLIFSNFSWLLFIRIDPWCSFTYTDNIYLSLPKWNNLTHTFCRIGTVAKINPESRKVMKKWPRLALTPYARNMEQAMRKQYFLIFIYGFPSRKNIREKVLSNITGIKNIFGYGRIFYTDRFYLILINKISKKKKWNFATVYITLNRHDCLFSFLCGYCEISENICRNFDHCIRDN